MDALNFMENPNPNSWMMTAGSSMTHAVPNGGIPELAVEVSGDFPSHV